MRDASVSNGAASVPPALLAGLTMRLPLDIAAEHTLPPAQNDPLIGRTLDGKYRIERRIGRGGSGTVYRARHLLIHRTVAVKVLSLELVADEDALARFRREAAMAGQLKHINIVSVTDFGITPDGVAYLVMDFIEGRSLRRILDTEATLAPERIVRWMKAVCSAVHAAHRKGIIHRDLKPDNVMIECVDEEEIPRVLDFGIAKLVDAFASNHDFNTETGSVMGTPHYMSPEQCEGKPLDPRSDIYSLGTLVYELLTGNVPFPGKVTTTVMMQQVTATPRPLRDWRPDLPEAVELCVMRALSKNPAARQSTALDFALELEAALASLPAGAVAEGNAPKATAKEPANLSPARPVMEFRAQLQRAAAIAPTVSLPAPASSVPVTASPSAPAIASAEADADNKQPRTGSLSIAEQRAATVQCFLVQPPVESAGKTSDNDVPSVPRDFAVGKTPDDHEAGQAAAASSPVTTPVTEGTILRREIPSPVRSTTSRRTQVGQRPGQRNWLSYARLRTWLPSVAWMLGMLVVGYALTVYGLYRQANARLGQELAALAQTPQAPLRSLRERVEAQLATRKMQVDRVRVRLDPPNRQITIQVRYRRVLLGLPLHFQAEGVARSVPMTLDMVAELTPAQAEVVNVSPRELERYRAERRFSTGQAGN